MKLNSARGTAGADLPGGQRTVDRFWSYVEKGDGCWLWQGNRNHGGYGRLGVGSVRLFAHRISWRIANERPVPKGLFVLHRCDNPPCVNPAHLFVGTQADNLRDMTEKGRRPSGSRHWTRRRPERVARGERHSSRTKPGSLPRGDDHWARKFPEKVVRGEGHWARRDSSAIRGERNGGAKLTPKDVLEIRRLSASGVSGAALARRFEVTAQTISKIIRRDLWAHLEEA